MCCKDPKFILWVAQGGGDSDHTVTWFCFFLL